MRPTAIVPSESSVDLDLLLMWMSTGGPCGRGAESISQSRNPPASSYMAPMAGTIGSSEGADGATLAELETEEVRRALGELFRVSPLCRRYFTLGRVHPTSGQLVRVGAGAHWLLALCCP